MEEENCWRTQDKTEHDTHKHTKVQITKVTELCCKAAGTESPKCNRLADTKLSRGLEELKREILILLIDRKTTKCQGTVKQLGRENGQWDAKYDTMCSVRAYACAGGPCKCALQILLTNINRRSTCC